MSRIGKMPINMPDKVKSSGLMEAVEKVERGKF